MTTLLKYKVDNILWWTFSKPFQVGFEICINLYISASYTELLKKKLSGHNNVFANFETKWSEQALNF